jgi:hypothetical protein
MDMVVKMMENRKQCAIIIRSRREVQMATETGGVDALSADDTVCRYCGISYLIHREVARLKVLSLQPISH